MKKSAPSPKLRVLIADDDEDDRQMLCEAMSDVKIEISVHNVHNGEKLMEYLAECNANLPDLIFLDLQMPRKNGFECLIEIRTGAKFKDTIIAIYSTSISEQDIDSTFHAGANIFITKPKSHEELQKILKDIFKINWHIHNSRLSRETFVMKR